MESWGGIDIGEAARHGLEFMLATDYAPKKGLLRFFGGEDVYPDEERMIDRTFCALRVWAVVKPDQMKAWIATLKETREFAGQCGLVVQTVEEVKEVELGYLFLRQFWGQGLASTALTLFLQVKSRLSPWWRSPRRADKHARASDCKRLCRRRNQTKPRRAACHLSDRAPRPFPPRSRRMRIRAAHRSQVRATRARRSSVARRIRFSIARQGCGFSDRSRSSRLQTCWCQRVRALNRSRVTPVRPTPR